MKNCVRCGYQNEDSDNFCRNCGEPLDFKNMSDEELLNGRPKSDSNFNQNFDPNYGYQNYNQGYNQNGGSKPTNGYAIAGLILAFFFPLLGLIFGIIGNNKAKTPEFNGEGKGLAVAAIIISAISMGFGLLISIVSVSTYLSILGPIIDVFDDFYRILLLK